MWDKIKDVIFHRAVQHGAASAAAVLVAYLSRPEVLATLGDAGVTVDPKKLSPAILAGLTFIVVTAYHAIRKKVEAPATPTPSDSQNTAAPGK